MKKYLNKNLFYQGDSSILILLSICYAVAFMVLKFGTSSWSDFRFDAYLYNNYYLTSIMPEGYMYIMIAYIFLIYVISVGIFKKKKWSTLLSGGFTRKDIRRRELTIIVLSALIFLVLYMIAVLQIYIKQPEVIKYMGSIFVNLILLDLMRLIGVAVITIGGLFLLDSIFSNLYALVTGSIVTGTYIIFIFWNLSYFMRYKNINMDYFNHIIWKIVEPIECFLALNRYSLRDINMTNMAMVFASFIVIGCICGLIASKLTTKIKVENMNDGIMFKFPKRIARFMLRTIMGLVLAPFAVDMINREYSLQIHQELLIILGVILVLTVTTLVAVKKLEKKLGKEILC